MTLCCSHQQVVIDESSQSVTGSMVKVYVAVGNDLQEGFKTLEWALRKWQPADNPAIGGVVLVHVSRNVSNDFVYGPFGKLPASSVSEEVLEVLKKQQQDDIDSLLHKYMAFCGKVKAEVVKVEKYDEPMYKLLVDLISGLHMTKLVIDLTFMKATSPSSSSWKSRTAIQGLFYIYHHKPDFCELSIVCGGKPVRLREEDAEGAVKDINQVMTIAARMRDKRSFKGWLGKMMFPESYQAPPTNQSDDLTNRWEDHVQEIENYFQQLLCLKATEGSNRNDDAGRMQNNQSDSALQARDNPNSNMSDADTVEILKRRIVEAHQTIERNMREAKIHAEGRLKAERLIRLCSQRIEDLGPCLEEERSTQVSIQRDLEVEQEQLREVMTDTEESKRRLHSLAQVQIELSNKFRMSMLSKAQAEARLEKAVFMRAEMVREIEELRRQRDVLRRRIEFCRERDAIGMVAGLNEAKCGYREYTAEDIRLATDNFSERRRLKSTSHQTNIYRGCIDHATNVVIEICNTMAEAFERKVRLLCQIKHPHVIAMVGFCRDLNCIIYEYMDNGSLQDILYLPSKRIRDFTWHDRLRVTHEISLGLGFLHSAKPRPIIHGHLNPSNILLDCNLVAKLGSPRLVECTIENDMKSDVQAFGRLMLHLLNGSSCAGLFDEAGRMDPEVLAGILDERAGEWPGHLAKKFGEVAMRCTSIPKNGPGDSGMAVVIEELGDMRREAEAHLAIERTAELTSNIGRSDDLKDVPSSFLCPIFRDIMKNPHAAADGFSYELEAIQEWLWTGHDTSPMTNLRLEHKFLTPNHILRSLIRDWQSQRLDSMPLED